MNIKKKFIGFFISCLNFINMLINHEINGQNNGKIEVIFHVAVYPKLTFSLHNSLTFLCFCRSLVTPEKWRWNETQGTKVLPPKGGFVEKR